MDRPIGSWRGQMSGQDCPGFAASDGLPPLNNEYHLESNIAMENYHVY